MIKTLICILGILFSVWTSAQSIWDLRHLEYVRANPDAEEHKPALEALISEAESYLCTEPVSVMMKSRIPASGDRHDYMSLARYFWPDPEKPDGIPYINRDGHTNPEIDEFDRNRLSEAADRVTALSLAWYFTGNEKYASKASEQLRVWFINEDTRMNPNLEYAQMIPGHNGEKGRCYGILDTYSFVEMLDAVQLLESSGSFTEEDAAALREWFGELLEWITGSPQGKEEEATANNHGTAYDVQITAFALFAGNEDLARKTMEAFPERRTFTQITPDGRQSHELGRTRAYHYSQYNLTHYIDIFMMAEKLGIKIDRCTSPDGSSFYKALDFLLPYVSTDGKERWPYEQIDGFEAVSAKLCKDLYRTAIYLDRTRKDYIQAAGKHSSIHPEDRFRLFYETRP